MPQAITVSLLLKASHWVGEGFFPFAGRFFVANCGKRIWQAVPKLSEDSFLHVRVTPMGWSWAMWLVQAAVAASLGESFRGDGRVGGLMHDGQPTPFYI